jgi:hypothetical protein
VPEEDLLFIRALEDSNRKALEAKGEKPVAIDATASKPATADKDEAEGDGEPLEVLRLPEFPEPFRDRGQSS